MFEKEWQYGNIKWKVPSGKGKLLIIVHCGSSEKVLLEDTNRNQMTKMVTTTISWTVNNLISKFVIKKSCLVMDNASCRNVLDGEDRDHKNDIRAWLL